MATISGLTSLDAAPADGDQFVLVDVSDTTQSANGTTKKLSASRVARTGAPNIFAPDAGNYAIYVNQPTAEASASGINVANNNAIAIRLTAWSGFTQIEATRRDLGNNVGGPRLYVARNSNAGTEGPAAGSIRMEGASGEGYVWRDASGNIRIHTAAPTGSSGSPTVSDTAGTVVGTQTSWHELKESISEWDGAGALDAVLALQLYEYQMIDDGQQTAEGEKPTYRGIVIMDEDRESNAWFGTGYGDQQVPVLNDRNLFGYLIASIQAQAAQIEALTARVAALEGA